MITTRPTTMIMLMMSLLMLLIFFQFFVVVGYFFCFMISSFYDNREWFSFAAYIEESIDVSCALENDTVWRRHLRWWSLRSNG